MKNAIYTIFFFLTAGIYSLHAQSWSELGGVNTLAANGHITSVCSDADGNIYAGGFFTNSLGNDYVAKYDGTNWSELGGLDGLSANSNIFCVCSDPSGNIYAAGDFTNGVTVNSGKQYVAKYDGTNWSELGGVNALAANDLIFTICSDPSGNIYASGNFTNASGKYYVAKYNGTAWSELSGLNNLAVNSGVLSLCSDPSGNIYAAGNFPNSSGNKYVAQWNGSTWSELGGLDALAANSYIWKVYSDASGNIYAAGLFTNSSGKQYVAKWNGTNWIHLGGNGLAAEGDIFSLCSNASGIYAAGSFGNVSGHRYVAKWDGSTWSELGGLDNLASTAEILSLCTDPSGNIYAGGNFTNGGAWGVGNSYVAMYDSAVTGINDINTSVLQVKLFPNPVFNKLELQVSGSDIFGFEIQNLIGKLITSLNPAFKTEGDYEIDISNLLGGIYLLCVKTSAGEQAVKFVKE